MASTFVLPGDQVPARAEKQKSLKLGPGLVQTSSGSSPSSSNDPIIATRSGILNSSENGKRWWVEKNTTRYVPSVGESVIGVIVARHAEGFRVDLGSAHHASLDALAFEGASKRNKPALKVGSLVYCRVSLANRDMEPEVECVDPTTHKAEGYGELKSGFMVNCSLGLARSFISQAHPLLPKLGARFPFEIAIGMNGRVWFKAPDTPHTILFSRAVEWADDSDPDQKGLLTDVDVKRWLDENLNS
ncbi:exosome complex exonuclease RRP40 [Clavulina sp. PMI_390]|nr:exosome complex exonuclease RRP40 [Clavulina sp. PMI_390]